VCACILTSRLTELCMVGKHLFSLQTILAPLRIYLFPGKSSQWSSNTWLSGCSSETRLRSFCNPSMWRTSMKQPSASAVSLNKYAGQSSWCAGKNEPDSCNEGLLLASMASNNKLNVLRSPWWPATSFLAAMTTGEQREAVSQMQSHIQRQPLFRQVLCVPCF